MFEKVCSVVVWTSVRATSFIVLLNSSVCLLLFCPVVLSIVEGKILTSQYIIIELSVSLCNSAKFCFIYFVVCFRFMYVHAIMFS
jgi:hypothetical protein